MTCGLEDYRRSSDHFGEILGTPPKCGGGGRNYDCWLGCAAKFLLSENSDKTPLTELAKNQAFPLFMAACGWRRPGFFTPSVTFENRASRSPDVFLDGWKKTAPDVSTSRHIVSELWLWLFMAACTLPNVFAVYKHFSSIKLKLDKHMFIQGVFSTVSPHFRNDKTCFVNEETLYIEYFLKSSFGWLQLIFHFGSENRGSS